MEPMLQSLLNLPHVRVLSSEFTPQGDLMLPLPLLPGRADDNRALPVVQAQQCLHAGFEQEMLRALINSTLAPMSAARKSKP